MRLRQAEPCYEVVLVNDKNPPVAELALFFKARGARAVPLERLRGERGGGLRGCLSPVSLFAMAFSELARHSGDGTFSARTRRSFACGPTCYPRRGLCLFSLRCDMRKQVAETNGSISKCGSRCTTQGLQRTRAVPATKCPCLPCQSSRPSIVSMPSIISSPSSSPRHCPVSILQRSTPKRRATATMAFLRALLLVAWRTASNGL